MSGTFSRYYTDYASTGVGKTVVYVYDELNRMTSASTTAASSTPYLRTYDYDDLGSMTYASDLGTYTYAETNYANPHAVTQVANGTATTTYAYDNSGNLLSASANNYTWDFRNRMTRSGGTATTTYGYDSGIQRMWKADGTATSTYPSRYFNKEKTGSQATSTKYLYAGDMLVATIEGNGTATSTKTSTQTTSAAPPRPRTANRTPWRQWTTCRTEASAYHKHSRETRRAGGT